MSNTNSIFTGPGIGSLLAILFIGLKLTGYIHWSWLWVLSPIWIPLVIVVVFCVSAMVIMMAAFAGLGR